MLDGLDDRPGVEPPGLRKRAIEGRDEGRLVLEQVEHPDRQDQVAEHEPEETPGTGQERQQEAQIEPTAAARPALADPGDDTVDPLTDGSRDLEVRVEVSELLELRIEVRRELREVGNEAQDLVDQRRQRQRQERDEGSDRDHVDDQDGKRPTHAATHQPSNRRIEQIDEEQADDEGPDAVASHPEQQADDDRGQDEDRHARGKRHES